MSLSTLQTLTCRVGDHSWSRPSSQGRPPFTCPEHTLVGYRTAKAPSTLKAPTLPTATLPPAPRKVAGQHKSFPLLLAYVRAGLHTYLYGPSGSGKTQGTKNVTEEIFGEGTADTHFFGQSCHPLMNAEDLFGFMGPHGYSPGIIREWLENEDGGILLLDEMDAANPALLVAINDILAIAAGKTYRFPDGVRLTRTASHIIVGAGNTNGMGATADYVGRSALDRATLDRFMFVDWNYDESMERKVLAGQDDIGTEWAAYVQSVRKAVAKNGLSLLVTPRAIINGETALRAGIKREDVIEATILKGTDADTRKTIKNLTADATDDETVPATCNHEANGRKCGQTADSHDDWFLPAYHVFTA